MQKLIQKYFTPAHIAALLCEHGTLKTEACTKLLLPQGQEHKHKELKQSVEESTKGSQGHRCYHGNRKHSDASEYDITEYICRPWPTAVYVTTSTVGLFFFVFLVLSCSERQMGTNGKDFSMRFYCFKIHEQNFIKSSVRDHSAHTGI